MNKTLKKFCLGILHIGDELSILNSQKIESLSHLEELIEKKKKKVGFNERIMAKIDLTGEKIKTAISYKKIDGAGYGIIINKNYLKTKVLDHELNHIFNHDFEHSSIMRYLFYEEPRAIIHTLLN